MFLKQKYNIYKKYFFKNFILICSDINGKKFDIHYIIAVFNMNNDQLSVTQEFGRFEIAVSQNGINVHPQYNAFTRVSTV